MTRAHFSATRALKITGAACQQHFTRAMHRLCYPQSILQPRYNGNNFLASWPALHRFVRYQAFEAGLDQGELLEARKWHSSFQPSSLPEGCTNFSRSSGPGGQHVNKTETKATTIWPVGKLLKSLPKMLHPHLRSLKYYSRRTDSIIIQAQAERSRSANVKENHQKLYQELQGLYRDVVPKETTPEKTQKYEALKKNASEARVSNKKHHSSKKQFRKCVYDD